MSVDPAAKDHQLFFQRGDSRVPIELGNLIPTKQGLKIIAVVNEYLLGPQGGPQVQSIGQGKFVIQKFQSDSPVEKRKAILTSLVLILNLVKQLHGESISIGKAQSMQELVEELSVRFISSQNETVQLTSESWQSFLSLYNANQFFQAEEPLNFILSILSSASEVPMATEGKYSSG